MTNQGTTKKENRATRPAKQANRPLFGAHMSVAGGLENACIAAQKIDCDCLQIFVKNQRQWQASPLTDEKIQRFKEASRAADLAPIFAHASYLLNLASPVALTRKKSLAAMIDELERCESLNLAGLVFHPGAHMDDTIEAGIARIAKTLNQAIKSTTGFATRILLETTAGQGTAIGYRFGQLSAIMEQVKESNRLGVCLDTCHLFAAGYDFRTHEGYTAMIDELDDTVGLANVDCIHTNDSKKALGSRVDRHEHIGKGLIGKQGFAHFVNDRRWYGTPFILETPKGKDGRGCDLDKVNIARLKKLIIN